MIQYAGEAGRKVNCMNCPFCGKEMTKGFMGAGGFGLPAFLYWLDDAYFMQHTAVPAEKHKIIAAGGCVLKNLAGLTSTPNTFYACKDCGKLIGDIA